ncbi:hypothetical protein EH223_01480 [candidate division KSB1 bacterium]|nr:PD40 domain-containing protein [candidate division KSB1 bacterium]RQW06870.1 MAG: hypothetical protein EH223_01480 [candidate division KSB1 bacterium]
MISLFLFSVFTVVAFLIAYLLQQRDEPEQNYRIRQFTSLPGLEDDPAFSPDGKKIAFCSNMDGYGGWDIYIKPVVGGDIRRLTQFYGAMSPVWSPDGKTIAFALCYTDADGIYTIPSDGGDTTKLFDVEWYQYWAKRMMSNATKYQTSQLMLSVIAASLCGVSHLSNISVFCLYSRYSCESFAGSAKRHKQGHDFHSFQSTW